MRILFLNPPFLRKYSRSQRSPAVTKSGTLYFPMWLAYAAGAAAKSGFEIDLVDAPADGYALEDVMRRAEGFGPELIVIDTSTPSIYNDAAVAGSLKDMFPSSFITLVGTHVSAMPEDVMNIDRRVDAVALYEYDMTVADLAKALDEKRELNKVPGLVFREGEKIVHSQPRQFIENLDELPFVSEIYKKFLRIENYFNPNALYPMVTITTSRGCPFPCTFCVYPQTLMGRKFRLRSIENVIAELKYIVESFPQAKAVFFEDDTLTASKKRCAELAALIMKERINISWTANARVGLDYETMKIMKQSGCRCLCVGFESGSQKILENMKKKIKIEEMKEFMENARKAGILIHGCFMAGLPGETKETLNETLELAKRLKPDTVQFYPVMVYPGTEAYNWYKERGLISTDDFSKWITPEGLHNTVISTEELSSAELVKFCDYARRVFYLRLSYIIYKMSQMITHPEEIKRTVKSARTFMKYLIKGSDVKLTNH